MTPPLAQEADRVAGASAAKAAVLSCLPYTILALRSDFLRAASARRQGAQGFLLQARRRDDGSDAVRVGFTCSKKIGNAVMRNRAKRRLRALAREVLATRARPGWDYVLVARPDATISRGWPELCADLMQALARIHRPAP